MGAGCGLHPAWVMVCSPPSWLRLLMLLPVCSADCRNSRGWSGGQGNLLSNERHKEIQMGNIFASLVKTHWWSDFFPPNS